MSERVLTEEDLKNYENAFGVKGYWHEIPSEYRHLMTEEALNNPQRYDNARDAIARLIHTVRVLRPETNREKE